MEQFGLNHTIKTMIIIKILLISMLLFTIGHKAFAQATVNNFVSSDSSQITRWIAFGSNDTIIWMKNKVWYKLRQNDVYFTKYNSAKNEGSPTSILWTDPITGKIKRSAFDTASMLSPYLKTAALASMLIPYSAKADTNSYMATKHYVQTSMNVYNAGTAISIASGVITNTAPDQTVSLTGSNGITASGIYPNFTVSKTKRQETYTSTTNSSGEDTVTFSPEFSVAPNIQATQVKGAANQILIVSSLSATGYRIKVVQRNSVNLLGIDVLLSTTVNVNAALVDVIVTEK